MAQLLVARVARVPASTEEMHHERNGRHEVQGQRQREVDRDAVAAFETPAPDPSPHVDGGEEAERDRGEQHARV